MIKHLFILLGFNVDNGKLECWMAGALNAGEVLVTLDSRVRDGSRRFVWPSTQKQQNNYTSVTIIRNLGILSLEPLVLNFWSGLFCLESFA